MHTALHAEGIETTAPALAGVFLYSNEAHLHPLERSYITNKDFYGFSEAFWMYYMAEPGRLILDGGSAMIMQARTNDKGEFVSIFDSREGDTTSLIFDSRPRKQGAYKWEVTVAGGNQRTIRQVDVRLDGTIDAIEYQLDAQGRLMRATELDEVSQARLIKDIRRMVVDPIALQNAEKLRTHRAEVEKELAHYAILFAGRHSVEKQREEEKRLTAMTKEAGFSALPTYIPPPRSRA